MPVSSAPLVHTSTAIPHDPTASAPPSLPGAIDKLEQYAPQRAPAAPAGPSVLSACPVSTPPPDAQSLAYATRLLNKDLSLRVLAALASPLKVIGVTAEEFTFAASAVLDASRYWERAAVESTKTWSTQVLKELNDFYSTADGRLCMERAELVRVDGYAKNLTHHVPRIKILLGKQRRWYQQLAPLCRSTLAPEHQGRDQSAAIKHLVRTFNEAELTTLVNFLSSELGREYIRGASELAAWSSKEFDQPAFKERLHAAVMLMPKVIKASTRHPVRALLTAPRLMLLDSRLSHTAP